MKTKVMNMPAGFWRIFLARMIDLFLVSVLSIGTMLFFLNIKTGLFLKPYYFYIWSILTIFYILLIMIALPLGFKGIGTTITRIKLISLNGSFYKNFLKRELAYSFAWIIVILLTTSIINHTLIQEAANLKGNIAVAGKILNPKANKVTLDVWEKTRITFCGSISGLITFLQMWLAITIIPNKQKRGWLDRWVGTMFIRIGKQTEEKIEKENSIIKPIKIKQTKIEYM